MRLLAVLILLLAAGAAQAAPWRIVKDHWDAADEAGYGRFIAALGDSGCSSSQSCLRDPANPWRGSDGRFLDIDVDCAKLPYLLRAYYAWKNGLPFTYADGVTGSRFGHSPNRIVSRAAVIDRGEGIDGPAAIRTLLDNVYSGTFRTDAARDDGDFYSPALRPGSIRPGTVIYDTNAHVAIVYRVDAAGRIYYMDAHPDFTISRSVFGPQFGQGPAALGWGLRNWRPLKLAGARPEGGRLVGGHYLLARNGQIADFSLVQYRGTATAPDGRPRWAYNGAPLGFYEYARVAVSGGRADFNPVYELEMGMTTLCNDLEERRQAVEQAVANGISARLHPAGLPADFYSSEDGTWESYATPARDGRLRAGFAALRRELGRMIQMWVNRDPRIVYDGTDLRGDLLAVYDRVSAGCTVTYLASDKRPVRLSFDDVAHRLFALSFDPYNCVELRWGDDGPACPDQAGKRRYYALEAPARRQTAADGTPLEAADTDIRGMILAMPGRVPWVQTFPASPGGAARPVRP